MFGLDRQFAQKDERNVFWFSLIEFGLVCLIEFGWVWFGLICLFHGHTNKLNNYLILINFICEFVFSYSTNKQIK